MTNLLNPLDNAVVFEYMQPLGPIYHGEPLMGYRRYIVTYVHMPYHIVDFWTCSCGVSCAMTTDPPCRHMAAVATLNNTVIRGVTACVKSN